MKCEYCDKYATHRDSVIDPPIAYRIIYLCLPHAIERRKENTSRVECLHNHLTIDGYCMTCGKYCGGV